MLHTSSPMVTNPASRSSINNGDALTSSVITPIPPTNIVGGTVKPSISRSSASGISPERSVSPFDGSANSAPTQPIPKKSQQIKTDKPRPHICTVCTRAFARLEHLKRHERSHTNEKPFQCAACGRCFARRDLVLRHQQKLHASLPSANSGSTPNNGSSRRSSNSKDIDANEHIIILHNNTNANAPLPNHSSNSPFAVPPPSTNQLNISNQNYVIKNEDDSNTSTPFNELHNFSPSKNHDHNNNFQDLNNGINANDNNKQLPSQTHLGANSELSPQFRTGLFNYSPADTPPTLIPLTNSISRSVSNKKNANNGISHSHSIPSPIPTNSNTPPNINNQPHHLQNNQQNDNITVNQPSQNNSHHGSIPNTRTNFSYTKSSNITQQPLPQTADSPELKLLNGYPNSIPQHLQQSGLRKPPLSSNSVDITDESSHTQQQLNNNNGNHSQYRHASFSAASAVSYTNLRDALSIQQNNNLSEAPLQVEFATPQLSAADLTSKGLLSGLDLQSLGIDWGNIDVLDLNNSEAVKTDQNSKEEHNAASIDARQPGFVDVLNRTTYKDGKHDLIETNETSNRINIKDNKFSANDQHSNNSPYFDPNVIAAHQFQNPNHPHHIKGTTPFEFGMNPPNDMSLIQQVLQMGTGGTGGLGGTGYDDLSNDNFQLNYNALLEKLKKRRIRSQHQNDTHDKIQSNPKKSKMISTSSSSDLNNLNNTSSANGTLSRSGTTSTSLDTGDWLQEIINTPYESNFPTASHHIGFTESPYSDSSPRTIDEISSLFRSRQIDLFKQMHPILPNGEDISFNNGIDETNHFTNDYNNDNHNDDHKHNNNTRNTNNNNDNNIDINNERKNDKTHGQSLSNSKNSNITSSIIPIKEADINVAFSISDTRTNCITEELRKRIILVSNLSNLQFPPLEDLNSYITLYEKEFNKYFPFIHLPSLRNPMVDNFENIPLLLSMAAIGALYSYHDSNTLLLFNLSKFHIQHFFEKEITLDNLQFKKVPLMAHQCLVLHIFISMFLNEPNMIEITSRQMKSMVGLIKSTNFHKPLEQFLIPPPSVINSNDSIVVQNNFDYFIMAQSRIRTIHCFYMLQVFRTSLIGLPVPLLGKTMESGTHCANENLWRCEDARTWLNELSKDEYNNDVKSIDLVKLSNNELMLSLTNELDNHYNFDSKLSYNNLLSLIIYIHEQIQCEYMKFKDTDDNISNILNWRLHSRPKLEKLIKSWESYFIKNGGFLVVNNHNSHYLNTNNEFKLILPLLSFAKIRLNINITPIMEKVLYKDWGGMNKELTKLDDDYEGLKECTKYANGIINLWIHNISIINDAKQTSLRTPVFFVTCVFVSILIISKYLDLIENSSNITVFDKVFWINCDEVLQTIESILSPINESNSYSELLRKQSKGVFDSISSDSFKENGKVVKNLIEAKNTSPDLIISAMKKCKLSTRSLFLGVRILADAPVWPLAMGFAEALKNRAIHIGS